MGIALPTTAIFLAAIISEKQNTNGKRRKVGGTNGNG